MDSVEINRYHQMLKAYIPSDRLMTPQEVNTILSQTNCQIYEMMKIMASTFKLGYKSGYKDTVELFKFCQPGRFFQRVCLQLGRFSG